jgi:hypothetical protein
VNRTPLCVAKLHSSLEAASRFLAFLRALPFVKNIFWREEKPINRENGEKTATVGQETVKNGWQQTTDFLPRRRRDAEFTAETRRGGRRRGEPIIHCGGRRGRGEEFRIGIGLGCHWLCQCLELAKRAANFKTGSNQTFATRSVITVDRSFCCPVALAEPVAPGIRHPTSDGTRDTRCPDDGLQRLAGDF